MTEPTREELQAQMADMQRQMAELQKQLNAQVSGSGASAQDHSVAAGAGGTAIGTIQGNAYFGPAPKDPAEALAIYRRLVVAGSRQLPLRGLDVGASHPTGATAKKQIDLDQVYRDLDTTTRVPLTGKEKRVRREEQQEPPPPEREESRALPILEATIANRRLVVLGDPGSGKSTFLAHLGLCLALHGLEPKAGWIERLAGWPAKEAALLPITVVLRDFARQAPQERRKATPQHMWDFVAGRLAAQNLEAAADPLREALEAGRAIVLFDGLDEIPTTNQRTFVRDAVAAFAKRYPGSRMIVTCRTLSYQDPAWQLEDVPPFELAPFDQAKIDAFIAAWHAELGRLGVIKGQAVDVMAQRLREALRRPDLWPLASNPLLLTIMALVHTHKGRLPDARALLYEDTVDILLWRWEEIKAAGEEETPIVRQMLMDAGRTDVDLKRVLWQLAFEAHKTGGAGNRDSLAGISEWQLEKALAELHPDKSRDWAHGLIEAIKLRAGLLLEREPEVYTFPHRTFQEYLAGAYLAALPDFATQGAALVDQGALWREVILLAAGRLVYLSGDIAKPLTLVAELCPGKEDRSQVAWRKAWLAGEVLIEMQLNRVQDSALGRDLLERVQQRLAKLLHAGALEPVERAAAGSALARLGDPRFRTDAWYLPNEPLLGFVLVPEGPFKMGSDKQRDRWATDRETPQHELVLPPFYIARYPVTVAQFQAFVDDSGRQPADPDSLGGLPNHPLVRVMWADALAYCEWLTERLRIWGATPEPLATLVREHGWCITLPSEAQWEKAARGVDERIFPWGDDPDPNRANCSDTGIRSTSAVGSFSDSTSSPYGCEDMSGNVWEWTRSLWGKDWQKPDFGYPYNPTDGRESLDAGREVLRVLRGGSFFHNVDSVRCAARFWNYPFVGYGYYGFRVCASPLRSAPGGSPLAPLTSETLTL